MGMDTVQNMVIGVILFVVVITGGVLWMGNMYNADSTIDTTGDVGNFNATLNKADYVTESAYNIQDNINSVASEDAGLLGWFNVFVNAAFNGLKAMFGSLSFISTALYDTGNMLGIGGTTVMLSLIGLVVIVIIGFALWAAIMRVNI